MKIAELDWMQVERYLERDDRAVVPLGSTEQHAYLSLATDAVLAERVAVEAAEPLGVPVFPPLSVGVTPSFLRYPGTLSLRLGTYLRVVGDLLDSLSATGFKRVLFVNGHGGNAAAASLLPEWMADTPSVTAKWHDWWRAPRTLAAVRAVDALASHASWMENFPWTRVAGTGLPDTVKPPLDPARLRLLDAEAARAYLQDGSFGGAYHKPDAAMLEIWRVGVEETREVLEGPWP